jgi:calcineurin-like phosphoesterase family protein
MPTRSLGLAGVALLAAALSSFCAPHLPPTTVPTTQDPGLEPFRAALQAYVDETQPYRKQAAQAGEQVPGKATAATGAEASVRARQNSLADALKTKLRPAAKPGDLFVDGAAAAIRKQVSEAFSGPRHDLLMDALAEQNDTGKAAPQPVTINEHIGAPRVPPQLLDLLPPLPKQLEYSFSGRALLLRDVDADVVVDYLPDTLPEQPPAGVPTTAPTPVNGATSPLPMPSIRGGLVFALMGDSGSGDIPQKAVAQSMVTYFTTARRFPLVLMLGDNLYDDDYTGEFSEPYKPLLDRGVTFHAALGNHDRDLEIHFKPFNMNDRDYYSFDQGNGRFVALNSNHPSDPAQAKFVDSVFDGAGSKWRICFFHHPLYSSGQHAQESRDVIRPALEPVLTRNGVNVVFGGHEHLYERIAPQHGIRYFVSGGGGRNLYSVHASAFDEVAISEHHFMVAEIAGDRLFYEAITPGQKVIDCGVTFRTTDAASKTDKDTETWMAACAAARPVVSTRAPQ